MGATAPEKTDAPAERATTTYTILHDAQGDGRFAPVGEVTVPAGRQDRALKQAVQQVADANPDDETYTVAIVPSKSWDPKTFGIKTETRLVAQ